ncbi:type II toxin-antitoxin system RelE/ParE family toxin [Paracoccus laeviglucosivorans]|uniref:type II toxin-antitoxin system RelE/ParE family toxin n=1 Tax=Paracoccus laeviglucosivorans TaxID=1197861 RepID=UPI0011584B96
MPRVTNAPAEIRDLQRLRNFLRIENPDAARGAGDAIRQGVEILGTHPRLGRMFDDMPEQFREWLIDFGHSGYVVRYRVDAETVTILAIRHRKEAGIVQSAELLPNKTDSDGSYNLTFAGLRGRGDQNMRNA